MSYLLPSFLQKRILRYALARLELLDTDGLDLEKLDITWGKKSTIVLRDIGINIGNISALLKLPRAFVITKARISTVRVTVPADIYQSSIEVEADGVDLSVSADYASEEDVTKASHQLSQHRGHEPSRMVNADGTRKSPPSASGPATKARTTDTEEDDDAHLPTSLDLAQSFMQSEPIEERSELQAAMAQSVHMSQSLSSNANDMDASEVGMGNDISLPGFLAGYLRGVGDRIKINVKNIAVDLVLGLATKAELHSTEDVKLRVAVNTLAVGEVSEDLAGQQTRGVYLKHIQLVIVSDQALFSNFAKSTNLSSPETTQARVNVTAGTETHGSSSSSAEASSSMGNRDDLDDHTSDHKPSQPSISATQDMSTMQPGRYRTTSPDSPAVQSIVKKSSPEDSFPSDSFHSVEELSHSHNTAAEQPNSPQRKIFGAGDEEVAQGRIAHMSKNTQEFRRYKGSPPGSFDEDSVLDVQDLQNHANAPQSAHMVTSRATHDLLTENVGEYSRGFSTPTTARSSPSLEDLSESKIFSHDQRESMYMSILSDNDPPNCDKEGIYVPGAWESTVEDDRSAAAESENLESGATSVPHRKKEKRFMSAFGNTASTKGTQLDKPAFPGKPLCGEELEDESPASTADPKVGIEPHTSGDPSAIRGYSESLPSSFGASGVLAKRVLSVDSIALKLPCGSSETLSRISTPADRTTSAQTLPVTQVKNSPKASSGFPPISGRSREEYNEALQLTTVIGIGKVQIVGDVALTKLSVLVAEKLSAACQPSMSKRPKSSPSRSQMSPSYVLTVDDISWKFVELVKATSLPDKTAPLMLLPQVALHEGADVLLSSCIEHLHLKQVHSEQNSQTKISVARFGVGYANADILSFNARTKMRESFQEVSAPLENDLRLEVVETKDSVSVDINTLPMHFALDLRRLDETFSWFGGFSSMLGLGSSMMSTVTLLDPSARASPSKFTPRVVHFDRQDSGSVQQQGAKVRSTKITARIAGVLFDLQGTGSSLRFASTAMKLVSRAEGLGMQIDRVKMHGPVIDNNDSQPPILANLANIRTEYLNTPKENDLTRLLTLLSPSTDTFGDEDDILVDTLLRQRKKGSVLRITIEKFELGLLNTQALQCFPILLEETKKLSTMAKYLPEDDRPGVLTLLLVKSIHLEAPISEKVGVITLDARKMEVANITFPSLSAIGIEELHVYRNTRKELFGQALGTQARQIHSEPHPMIMARFVGNEMEPTVKMNLYNARFEYHVNAILSFMDLGAESAAGDLMSETISSVVELAGRQSSGSPSSRTSGEIPIKNGGSLAGSRTLRFDVTFRDVILGLNPLNSPVKGLMVFTDAHFTGSMPEETLVHATLGIRKAELMIIDDISRVSDSDILNKQKNFNTTSNQVQALAETGYVSISQISAMKINLQVTQPTSDSGSMIEADISDYLFVLESCADSTQTVTDLLKGLKPPIPKSTALKYQTEIIPVEDMLASFSGEAFATGKGSHTTQAHGALDDGDDDSDSSIVDDSREAEFASSFYSPDLEYSQGDSLKDSVGDDGADSIAASTVFDDHDEEKLSDKFQEQMQATPEPPSLDIRDDYFDLEPLAGGTGPEGKFKQNTNDLSKENFHGNPLRVRMRNVHVIWNLFDGYDWQHTRDAISQAVAEVQTKAIEWQAAHKRKSFDPENEDEDVIGDFLFNSIYIGIPAKSDPAELARQINHNIDDLVSETASFTTSNSSRVSPNRALPTVTKSKQLRLKRSKHHKMTFELKGVSADLVVFTPNSGETESSLDIRVQDLEIFDHVPTSTWKKFATYMHDAGEKESGTSMIHIEIQNVKPVPDLAASEIMLKVSVLPLRLHVDQDALDFMTRFFSFKVDSASDMAAIQADAPFIQRAEFKSVRIRLDFKPKRINYAGLRSGRTTEFMNFLILDSADMVLRHAIVYGVSGFDRLGNTLNDIWMPDIKRNQLPGVLAGLAPVRSLVNVGGGMRDLFVVPIREYKKDGRVVRSFQKGAFAFAKTTTSELMRLGAKLAIGTQNVLQNAEDILNSSNQTQDQVDISIGWDEADMEESEKKQISLYADQPIGVIQGLRGAYASLERDLLTTRDAVVAMPGEIMESGTAGGAAKAVLRRAPTVILRPAMGVSMAVGQTLMGATNSLDPGNRRRIEDKYKKH